MIMHTSFDYRTQIQVSVAVDFTSSNGNPSDPESLHYSGGSAPSPYHSAIEAVVSILEDYDSSVFQNNKPPERQS